MHLLKNKSKNRTVTFAILLLLLLEISSIFLACMSYNHKGLDKYRSQMIALKNDMFAIMIENEDGTYTPTNENIFPNADIYKFNNELSGCIDYSGNNVKDALTYDEVNNKVTATVSGTSYCYLYFDSKFKFKGDTLAGHLINNPAKYNMWYSGLENDGHRFTGNNPNNYVCFGTSDKSTCTSNPGTYMYRIIGVFDEGDKTYRVKLIKNNELGTAYAYHNATGDTDWPDTQLSKGLNSNYYYGTLSEDWKVYIDNWKWSAVNTLTSESSSINYSKTTSTGVYAHELNRSNKQQIEGEWLTPETKVSLMYVSDYMLSLGSAGFNYTSAKNANDLKTSWLTPPSNEWTMSRYGLLNSVNQGWTISNNGTISNSAVNSALKVRPTFYLSSYVKYESGTGTQTDPIMIYKPLAPKGSITFNKNNLTATITKGDYDLDSYCINMSSSTEDCKWTPVTTTTITKAVTEFGFYYIHIIDKEGYIGHSDGVEYRPSMADDLIKSGAMWQSGLEGDGYRYTGSGNATAGTTPKNFVCFGTNDKSTCTGNPNNYMYRIIGVFPDASGTQYVKLIKYANMTSTKWNSSSADVDWSSSTLYSALNGSMFLTNTTYVPNSTWSNKIANWKWTAVNTKTSSDSGPDYYSGVNTQQMYLHEMNRSNKTSTIGAWTTPSAKIGLMYASDYQMSLGASSLNYKGSSNYSTLKTGWMHISNNVDAAGDPYDWTISRYGDDDGYYYAWRVNSSGGVGGDPVYLAYAVRPVFYLASTVQLQSGSGTLADPYIIN